MDEVLDVMVILDRSGSMQARKADHEGGLRSFVEDQQKLDGDVRFTLIQFDTENPCEIVYDRVSIRDVRGEDIKLIPRGGTPLLDAVGRATSHLMTKDPVRVICMIITDGEENSSIEWNRDKVKARLVELESKNWTPLYLGADVDAFREAGRMGIDTSFTAVYDNAHVGISNTYRTASNKLGGYRRAATASARSGGPGLRGMAAGSFMMFNDSDRAYIMEKGDEVVISADQFEANKGADDGSVSSGGGTPTDTKDEA